MIIDKLMIIQANSYLVILFIQVSINKSQYFICTLSFLVNKS